MVICLYCGGECVPVYQNQLWKVFECEKCRASWAMRPDPAWHDSTLERIHGEQLNSIIAATKKRLQELKEEAVV